MQWYIDHEEEPTLADVQRWLDAVTHLDDMHRQIEDGIYCCEDGFIYRCRTIRVLEGERFD